MGCSPDKFGTRVIVILLLYEDFSFVCEGVGSIIGAENKKGWDDTMVDIKI